MRLLAGICALWLLCSGAAHAQVLYGSLVGNVTDESGAAIPNASVTATNRDTNLVRQTTTNNEGLYGFPNVPSGNYVVKVTAPGFSEFTGAVVQVAANTTVRVDAPMKISGIAEQVTVTAEGAAAVLQTDRAEVRREIPQTQIENLPVPVGRNYQNLFTTLPGFEMSGNAREARMGGCNPSRSRSFNVNGTSRSTTSTSIDGATSQHIWAVGNSAVVPALESIETVSVVTNSFDAEQGLAGGAVINVQIKSGTNDFHGSAFEYHHNQHLRARSYFLPATQGKGKFISNQYGGTLGGPIVRDKLFFFGSYEGRHERENSTAILSVPTAAARRGDFSRETTRIYDPLTGNSNGTGRVPFAGNIIPTDRLHPISQKVLSYLPLPNYQPLEAQASSEINNFFASQPFAANKWSVDTKINWQTSDKFNVFGSVSMFDFDITNPTAFGPDFDGARVGGGNAGQSWGRNTRLSFGANYIFSPTLLADAFFGWGRQNTNVEQPGIGTNFGTDVLGLPGTNGPERFQSGWPYFNVSGFAAMGTEEPWTPYYRRDDQFSIRANFTKTLANHEIRWGTDNNTERMNHTQPEFQGGASMGARGRFNFGTGPTSLCLTPNTSGGCSTLERGVDQINSMGTFLLGLPTEFGKNLLTTFPYSTRAWRYSLYIRDRWQVNQKLTLSFGTRWEYYPMPTRADRGLERYDPLTDKMQIGGVGNVPEDLGVKVSKKHFAPRFGLAYRATNDTVIRAGYGISIDPYSLSRPLRTNHPILIELVVPAPNNMNFAGRLENGIPAIPVPSLGDGIIDVPANVSTQTVPLDLQRGYVQSWNFTVEHKLGWGFIGEAGYVATRQIRQLSYNQLNWATVGAGNPGRQLFRRFGRTAAVREVGPVGNSTYDSLQAQLQRRFANGFSLGVAYTFAKSITSSGVDVSDGTPPIAIPEYYHLNRSVSGFDRPHNLQITNITDLPFGRGRKWLNEGGVLAAMAGGWQTNSIISVMSGRPFSVSANATTLNAPFSSQRADQIKPEVEILGGVGRGQPYFDPTAYAPVNEPRFGTAGFNSIRGPGRVNWDLGVFRNFRFTERWQMQFRAEAFNVTNTPKFGNPGANVSSAQFNPDGSIRNLNGFAEITSATEERQFSLGLRLSF
jgi:outer membrane receptor protein involved in Fe transport